MTEGPNPESKPVEPVASSRAGKAVVLGMVALAVGLTGYAMYFKQTGGLRYAEKQLGEQGIDVEAELQRAALRAVTEHAVRSRLAAQFADGAPWAADAVLASVPSDGYELTPGPAPWVLASRVLATGARERWTPWREDHVPFQGAEPDLAVPSVEVLTAIGLLEELRARGVTWPLAISAFGILGRGDGDPRLDTRPLTVRFKEKQAWKLTLERPDGPPFVYAALAPDERTRRAAFLDEVRGLVASDDVLPLKWANYLPTLQRQLEALAAEGRAQQIPYRLQVSPKFPWTIAAASPGDGDFRWIQAPRRTP